MFSSLRQLPNTILALVLILAAVPFFALTFSPAPWLLLSVYSPVNAALVLGLYWVMPPLLCILIFRRSFFFVPVFLVECFAFILHAAMGPRLDSAELSTLRYVLIGLMSAVGLLFLDRDFLYPFFSHHFRLWRQRPRFETTALAQVVDAKAGQRLPIAIEDCSAMGMAISGDRRALTEFAPNARQGEAITVRVSARAKTLDLAGKIAWVHDEVHMRRIGVKIDDHAKTAAAMAMLVPTSGQPWRKRLRFLWVRSSVQRSLTMLFLGSTAGSYVTPACGTSTNEQIEQQPESDGAKGSDGLEEDRGERRSKVERREKDEASGEQELGRNRIDDGVLPRADPEAIRSLVEELEAAKVQQTPPTKSTLDSLGSQLPTQLLYALLNGAQPGCVSYLSQGVSPQLQSYLPYVQPYYMQNSNYYVPQMQSTLFRPQNAWGSNYYNPSNYGYLPASDPCAATFNPLQNGYWPY